MTGNHILCFISGSAVLACLCILWTLWELLYQYACRRVFLSDYMECYYCSRCRWTPDFNSAYTQRVCKKCGKALCKGIGRGYYEYFDGDSMSGSNCTNIVVSLFVAVDEDVDSIIKECKQHSKAQGKITTLTKKGIKSLSSKSSND